MNKWFIILPPEGAARSAGERVCKAFALKAEKKNVKVFDTAHYLKAFDSFQKIPDSNFTVDLLNQSLIVQCLDFNTTHLLVLALSPVTLFATNLLQRQNIKTIHWFYEDYRRAKYWKSIIAGYDYFLAIQRGEVEESCRDYSAQFVFMPTAASFDPPDSKTEKTHDVSFVGLPSQYRIRFLEHLAQNGIDLIIGGTGWEKYKGPLEFCIVKGSWIDSTEYSKIIGSVKIGINLSISSPHEDRDNTHISPRVFDIMQAGSVLLTEDVPLLTDVLDGYEYYLFTDEKDAANKIKEIKSKNWEEFCNLVDQNRSAINTKDTYTQRAEQIIKLCGG